MYYVNQILSAIGYFIFNFQTLITGILAVGVAVFALRPVYRQLRLTQTQMAISGREVLQDRLEVTARRARTISAELRAISDDFSAQIYQDDPDGEPNIQPEWAFGSEQLVDQAIDDLNRQQISKVDTQAIDDKRAGVIVVAEALKKCLRDIHLADSINLDDEEYNLTDDQIVIERAKLNDAQKAACAILDTRIGAVKAAAKALNDEFQTHLVVLRERIRQINDILLKDDQTGK